MPPVVHWDEVERERLELGELASWATDLGTAAGSVTIGVTRWQLDPDKRSTPAHVELAEEEIFYVLAGSGLSWQNGETYEVGPGDCLVHPVRAQAHTLRSGSDGLDVLAFGMRVDPGGTHLPRARVVRMPPAWVADPGDPRPWEREIAAGPLEFPAPTERPQRIVNMTDVPVRPQQHGSVDTQRRFLGRAAGSRKTGLNHVTVASGKLSAAPHCHSAEEEIFVVLEGEGDLELTPAPDRVDDGLEPDRHPVRAGSVVARPAGTGVAHAFRAGHAGLTLLAYGTREPNDIAYYPRSRKLFFRGVGVIAGVEHVDYWEGED